LEGGGGGGGWITGTRQVLMGMKTESDAVSRSWQSKQTKEEREAEEEEEEEDPEVRASGEVFNTNHDKLVSCNFFFQQV